MLRLLGRLAYFALLGLVAIVAAGPVVAIVGVMLPFALIGLVVWGAYRGLHALLVGREKDDAILDVVAAEAHEPAPRRPWLRRAGRLTLEVSGGALVAALVAAALCWGSTALPETVLAAAAAGGVVGFLVGGERKPATSIARPECSNGGC